MGDDHHTPYQNGITLFKAQDMGFPIQELDNSITSISGELDFHYFGSGENDVADGDEIRIWDISAGKYKKVTRANLLAGASNPYDIGLYLSGEATAGANLLEVPMARTVNFAIDMGASKAHCSVLATADAVFSIKKGATLFAEVTFNPSGENATFSGEAQSLVTGELLTVVCPDPADTTLAGIGFTLAGTRED